MTLDPANHHKALLEPLRAAQYDFSADGLQQQLQRLFVADAPVRLGFPFETMDGPVALYQQAYAPMYAAFPDLERRDYIVIAGQTEQGRHWVGCAGYYTGTMMAPWLHIPPTGHQVAMRFHEFYQFEDDKVVQFQALWDIPEVMMQANAWPMAPSLGREWLVPAPATMDGLVPAPYNKSRSQVSCQHVVDMLTAMKRHPAQGGPELMEMERFWHPKMNWYGPAGIGTGRGIAGFRHWHQIPFLNAMPDRGQYLEEIDYHFFADDCYVGVTGWPDMIQSISHDGWMGLVPTGKKITMRSLDFWRLENGRIRENWVLVDLLDVYNQLGVDVFARLAEFNKARHMQPLPTLDWKQI